LAKELKTQELDIRGFIETSFLDWDGHIVSTLYVPLCNFRCPYCHNFGLIENPGQYDLIPHEAIESFLLQRKNFIDGICLTGGEPCLHKNRGLFEFIRRIKDLGFKIKFDTNGSDPEAIKILIDERLIHYIAVDVKGPLDERYDKLSGVKTDIGKIKQTIAFIMGSGVPYEFRTTVVPTLLDTKDIEDIAKHISGAKKFVFQQFVAENTWSKSLRKVKPYERKKLEEMCKAASPYVKECIIRGV